jgi:hypothetical protein
MVSARLRIVPIVSAAQVSRTIRRRQAQVEERARSLASRHGWDVAKLETLSVDASKFKRSARYKVDVKSRSLVEIVERKVWVGKSPLRRKR